MMLVRVCGIVELDLPEEEARELISSGKAEPIEPETAAVRPPRNAARPRPQPRTP